MVLSTLQEVDGFVQQIGAWLVERGVKLVVIACNTATAAGLAHAQERRIDAQRGHCSGQQQGADDDQ